LQTGALVETEYAREITDAMGSKEQVSENEIASDVREPGARIVSFDVRARVLDEFSIFDTRRAGGFARAAVETFIDVVDEGISDPLPVQLDLNHLVDPPARRIRFEVPETVGGAGVEAQAAVHAAGVVLVDGMETRNGGRGHGWVRRDRMMIRLPRPLRKRVGGGRACLRKPTRSWQAGG